MVETNLVQAEFFHIGRRSRSLTEDLAEASERMYEDIQYVIQGGMLAYPTSMKTTVRFPDDKRGTLTRLACTLQQYRKEQEDIYAAFSMAPEIRRAWLNWRSKRLAELCLTLGTQARDCASDRLVMLAKEPDQIAIERIDRSFRPVCRNEVHELCERAQYASRAWLFVFEPPEELCAETNRLIAAGM